MFFIRKYFNQMFDAMRLDYGRAQNLDFNFNINHNLFNIADTIFHNLRIQGLLRMIIQS